MAGRPENPLDRAAGPVPQFASGLRDLRKAAKLSYRAMAEKAHYSPPALSTAANGKQMPTWEVTEAYVKACGGDVEEWRVRWRDTKQLLEPDQKVELPGRRRRRRSMFATEAAITVTLRPRIQVIGGAVVCLIALVGTVLFLRPNDSAAPPQGAGGSWTSWDPAAPTYLDVLVPVSGKWSGTSKDASIGGHPAERALQQVITGCSGRSTVEYRIGKDYTRLEGQAGIDDNSQSTALETRVELLADGKPILAATIGYGDPPTAISLDLTGVDRLQIRYIPRRGTTPCTERAVLDFANMTLTPSPVPTTASSIHQ